MRVAALYLSFFFLLTVSPPKALGQHLIRGRVVDATSGEGLVAAHVAIVGTGEGTITNRFGTFVLAVDALPVQISVRYIGFASLTVSVESATTQLTLSMEPSIANLDEIVVSSEDFGVRIMREVLRKKGRLKGSVKSFRRNGYVRMTLSNGGELQVISQHIFDDYFRASNDVRVVALATSETSDIYRELGLDPLADRVDLNDDTILIQGQRFVGPTHPDALSKYNFVLGGRRVLDDKTVFDIFISPANTVDASFIGRISILDEDFVMLEAELRPARHVVFDLPIRAWDIFYRQQFAPVTDSVWLPVDLRMEGRIHVDPQNLGYEPATLNLVSQLSKYSINTVSDAPVFSQSEYVVIDSAYVLKNLPYVRGSNMVPLTPREAEALGALYGTKQSLESAFLRKGVNIEFAQFEAQRNPVDESEVDWPDIRARRPWLRFNRVDGFFLGIGQILTISPSLELDLRAAQTTGFERIRFLSRGTYRKGSRLTVLGEYVADTKTQTSESLYPVAITSFSALTGRKDYNDHYWSRQVRTEATYALPKIRFKMGGRSESTRSLEKKQNKVWPFNETLRHNPAIEPGRLNSLSAAVILGEPQTLFQTAPFTRFSVSAEYSDKDFLQSEYQFVRFSSRLDLNAETLFRSRPLPARLRLRIVGSTFSGSLPSQSYSSIDGTIASYSSFGAFKSLRDSHYRGDQAVSLFWSHNFNSIFFEWLGLNRLTRSGTGIAFFGGHGRTWYPASAVDQMNTFQFPAAFHHEVGASVTNIWGSPVQIDFTYRLDDPGFYFGFGFGRLWK